jgi:hypothetical protein
MTKRRKVSRELLFQIVCLLLLCILSSEFVITTKAGARGIGKYCGVVVFDRWDTCLLLSGPYITYISESVKNELRPYKGKAMQVDASRVIQHQNPGDALIQQYTIVGPAPDTGRWAKLDGLELFAESDFGLSGSPTFLIEIRNSGSNTATIESSEVGPTLLTSNPKFPFAPSDGGSGAVITRGNLINPGSWSSTNGGETHFAAYDIDPASRPGERFQLNPGQTMSVRITFKASPGQYQFLFGYGGGVHEVKSLASNAISFDLNQRGVATLTR